MLTVEVPSTCVTLSLMVETKMKQEGNYFIMLCVLFIIHILQHGRHQKKSSEAGTKFLNCGKNGLVTNCAYRIQE